MNLRRNGIDDVVLVSGTIATGPPLVTLPVGWVLPSSVALILKLLCMKANGVILLKNFLLVTRLRILERLNEPSNRLVVFFLTIPDMLVVPVVTFLIPFRITPRTVSVPVINFVKTILLLMVAEGVILPVFLEVAVFFVDIPERVIPPVFSR
jgi:hypothetical protein